MAEKKAKGKVKAKVVSKKGSKAMKPQRQVQNILQRKQNL